MYIQNKIVNVGRSTDWNEAKRPHHVRLTDTCWRHLDDIAAANDLPSKMEAIEHLSRFAVKNYIVFHRDSETITFLDNLATKMRMDRSELMEGLNKMGDRSLEQLREQLLPDVTLQGGTASPLFPTPQD